MPEKLLSEMVILRNSLEDYIRRQPAFLTSHKPLELLPDASATIRMAGDAGFRTSTGPMAAVAGLFAWYAGEYLRNHFQIKEIVIENGGDFYLLLEKDLLMTIYAGSSPLSGRIGVVIPAVGSPWGVCTSSGTVGHSFSYGKADAVMVACESPLLADGWATSLANQVQSPADIPGVLSFSEQFDEIVSLVVICKDKVGIRGNFDTRVIKNSFVS